MLMSELMLLSNLTIHLHLSVEVFLQRASIMVKVKLLLIVMSLFSDIVTSLFVISLHIVLIVSACLTLKAEFISINR